MTGSSEYYDEKLASSTTDSNGANQNGNTRPRLWPNFIALSGSATAAEALTAVRVSGLPQEMLNALVLSDGNGEYAGYVRLTSLIRAATDTQLEQLAEGRNI